MEDYYPQPQGKLKRKELEEVSDEFSDFSLSSQARKIRRLDAELPPIIEEEEPEIPIELEQPQPEQNFGTNARSGLVIEDLTDVPENEERALVLFKPKNTPFFYSPSNFSVSIDPQLISGFKNQVPWSNQSNPWRSSDNEVIGLDKNSDAANRCLAVVPWVPSQHPSAIGIEAFQQTDLSDVMEAEEIDEATMDIEDCNGALHQGTGVNVHEGAHQSPQQHCMIPQLPQSTSTPVVWFR